MEGKEKDGGNKILLRQLLLVFFGRIMEQQARNDPLLFIVGPANGREMWWGWARKARRNLANTWPQTSFFTAYWSRNEGLSANEAAEIRASRKVGTLFGQSCCIGRDRYTLYSIKQKLLF